MQSSLLLVLFGQGSCILRTSGRSLVCLFAQAGEQLGDEMFYTDKAGGRDHEYISLGCDHEPVLDGRTPIQCYTDFVAEFQRNCKKHDLWGQLCSARVPLLYL